jgi:predicted RNase H-like HicB family nuclease
MSGVRANRAPWGATVFSVVPSIDFTIAFDEPDEEGWVVARVLEVPGALSQGRTREEARENVLDALRTVLTPDDELSGRRSGDDLEHLRFVAAA